MSFPKLEPITEETLTHEHVERVRRAILGVPRKNSLHRAILADCAGVIAGNNACRETVVRTWNAMVAPSAQTPAARRCCAACGEEGDDRVCPACEHDHGNPPPQRRCAACGEEGDDRVCPACEHDHGDPAFEALEQ